MSALISSLCQIVGICAQTESSRICLCTKKTFCLYLFLRHAFCSSLFSVLADSMMGNLLGIKNRYLRENVEDNVESAELIRKFIKGRYLEGEKFRICVFDGILDAGICRTA